MGYTHYFKTSGKSLTKEQADGVIKHVAKVFKQHKDIIQREYDNTAPPVLDAALNLSGKLSIGIFLNGKGEYGHETFAVHTGDDSRGFCKTSRKPYDIVVSKVLLILKHYLGDDMELGSDGFSTYQPSGKAYKVGDKVLLKNLSGTWGKAARAINAQLKTNFHFIVDDVYGKDGCYFSYKLKQ